MDFIIVFVWSISRICFICRWFGFRYQKKLNYLINLVSYSFFLSLFLSLFHIIRNYYQRGLVTGSVFFFPRQRQLGSDENDVHCMPIFKANRLHTTTIHEAKISSHIFLLLLNHYKCLL